jgi:hypothetical protein
MVSLGLAHVTTGGATGATVGSIGTWKELKRLQNDYFHQLVQRAEIRFAA